MKEQPARTLAKLNRYLPASTPHLAAVHLRSRGRDALALGAGGTLDIGSGCVVSGPPYTLKSAENRAARTSALFPFETDPPAERGLEELLQMAEEGLRQGQRRIGVFPDYEVRFATRDGESLGMVVTAASSPTHQLTCFLDERLLSGILEGGTTGTMRRSAATSSSPDPTILSTRRTYTPSSRSCTSEQRRFTDQ